ncbi:MAG: histidine phosphatase family protein [Ilumatobacter sp.]|uniref:histidine phosphatase family protein n=1 Tax=Ilumatobacter sp. TaxID=1967498 RepID=UPI003C706A54
MELLLIRHGLPIRRELTEGIADPELAPDGLAQAALLGEYLASEHLDAVYASSLRRAQQTAEPVVVGRDLELRIEPDVAEFDKDSPEYVPVEELKANNDPRWQAMLDGTMEGMEDHEVFARRSIAGVDRIIDAHRGHRVAVVCHGGVINAYLSHILGLDPGQRGFFYPNYTSIHRVAAASSGERSVVTVNETTHLRGSGLPMGLFQKG